MSINSIYTKMSSISGESSSHLFISPQEKSGKPHVSQGYIPLSQEEDKKFKMITLSNTDSFAKIKGGEIGYIASQSNTTRKIISNAQKLFSVAPHNSTTVHAFVVCGKVDPDTINTAEAVQRGLKEQLKKLSELEDDEVFIFFQPLDPKVRKELVKTALKSVDLLPSDFKNKPLKYVKDYEINEKNNGLYNFKDLVLSPILSSKRSHLSFDQVMDALADTLMGKPFLTEKGKRKAFICSGFATLCYQVSILKIILSEMEPQFMKKLKTCSSKSEILQKLNDKLKKNSKILQRFYEDKISHLNYRWLFPGTLKHNLDQCSE